jgi:hypothetical protein
MRDSVQIKARFKKSRIESLTLTLGLRVSGSHLAARTRNVSLGSGKSFGAAARQRSRRGRLGAELGHAVL